MKPIFLGGIDGDSWFDNRVISMEMIRELMYHLGIRKGALVLNSL